MQLCWETHVACIMYLVSREQLSYTQSVEYALDWTTVKRLPFHSDHLPDMPYLCVWERRYYTLTDFTAYVWEPGDEANWRWETNQLWHFFLHFLFLQLEFDACFHEHKSMQTWPPLHLVTGMLYRYTKLLVYHFLVVLIGFIFAFIWAIINGINTFIHVWIWGPTLKFIQVWIFALAPVITVPLRAILTPLVDAQARIFRQIRVHANLNGPFAKAFAGQDCVQQTTSL